MHKLCSYNKLVLCELTFAAWIWVKLPGAYYLLENYTTREAFEDTFESLYFVDAQTYDYSFIHSFIHYLAWEKTLSQSSAFPEYPIKIKVTIKLKVTPNHTN